MMTGGSDSRTALFVAGGGARAAYEVGVLKALRELLGERRSPFAIHCGVSGGAINAAGMALAADDFGAGVSSLEAFWSNLQAGDVYRADPLGVVVSGGRWLFGTGSRALFDNAPLRGALERLLDFGRLAPLISAQSLRALSVSCSGYASGQCVTFFHGRADLEPWRRTQRVGAHVTLGVNHIMASMAMPFLFPAVKLHREHFGDGAMRQLAPLSPAVRLGADRILVIGSGRMAIGDNDRAVGGEYPGMAETAGHVLAAIHEDGLSADIERMAQVNRLVARIPAETRQREGLCWRPIELMVIEPSVRLDLLAGDFVGDLPWAVQALLRSMGVRGDKSGAGGELASYLLFEAGYARRLIELGYHDAMARCGEISAFLDLDLDRT